jgi:putative molybdopterin biosynthesis protein
MSDSVEDLHEFDQIGLLADPRRREILRRLMAGPATLTQLGQAMGEHPAWIRHHLKRLEQGGLIELAEVRQRGGAQEKLYRAKAGALVLRQMILPDDSARRAIVFAGSHDLAVELLAGLLAENLRILTYPVGSLDGLMALRQGLCHLSGAHLLDATGEYNVPFVRHVFPDRLVLLITLAHREQGLMLAPGNPKRLRSLTDLARPGVVFVNRQRGSGTRLWFDRQVHDLGLPPEQIEGYAREVSTHTECAAQVARGAADSAVGLRAAASQKGLDFLPLFQERYDLILPQDRVEDLSPLLDMLQSGAFRREVSSLVGYDTTHTGHSIPC